MLVRPTSATSVRAVRFGVDTVMSLPPNKLRLAMKRVSSQPVSPELAIFALRRESVSQLQGFRKSHRLPDDPDSRQRYLEQIGHNDLNRHLDEAFAKLREQFGFRRRQLEISGPQDGFCLLETPEFDLEIALLADEENARACLWRHAVSNIRQRELLSARGWVRLQRLLVSGAAGLQIPLNAEINLEMLIDSLEDHNSPELSVDYDREVHWCDLTISNIPVAVRISGGQITVTGRNGITLTALVTAWAEFQDRFDELVPRMAKLDA